MCWAGVVLDISVLEADPCFEPGSLKQSLNDMKNHYRGTWLLTVGENKQVIVCVCMCVCLLIFWSYSVYMFRIITNCWEFLLWHITFWWISPLTIVCSDGLALAASWMNHQQQPVLVIDVTVFSFAWGFCF